MKLKIKKKDILPLIPIIVIGLYFLYNTSWLEAIGTDWQPCLDYFAKGELYQGQLICPYGPVYFGIGYLFKLIFSDFYQIALRLFLLISFGYTVYLLIKISQKGTSKKYYLIIIFLSLLWIYPQTVAAKPEKAFAVFFTFFGFYMLYYTTYKFKEVASAILFSLAMYSSFNPAPLIALISFMYIFRVGIIKILNQKIKPQFNFSKENILKYGTLIFSLVFIFVLVKLIYPNFLIYSLFSHAFAYEKYNLPLSTVLKEFLPVYYMPVVLFLIYVLFIVCLLAFKNTKNSIPIIGFFGLVGIVISYKMGIGEFQLGRMVAPAVPFVILSIIFALNSVKKQTYERLLLYLSLFFLIIFPGYELNHFNVRIYDSVNISLRNLQNEIGYGAHFLPHNKIVLAQYSNLLTKYGYETYYLDVVEGTLNFYTPVDTFSGQGLIKQGIGNYSLWYGYTPPELIEKELKQKETIILDIEKKIASGKYDIITWHEEDSPTVIKYAIEDLKKKNVDINQFYVPIELPNFDQKAVYSVHGTRVLMKNTLFGKESNEALKSIKLILEYYSGIWEHVCKKSEYLANGIIKNIITANTLITNVGEVRLDINKKCDKGGTLYRSFESYVLFGEHIIIILLIVVLSMLIYVPHLKQNNKLNNKKEKIIYFGIIIVIILLAIYVIFLIANDLGYYLEVAKQIKIQ